MGKEVVESSLKIIKGMCGGVLRHFVCPWKFFATDSIEAVPQLASGQSTLTLLMTSLPFRQAPVVGKAATAYGLTEVSHLLVVRHELYAMGECNHSLFRERTPVSIGGSTFTHTVNLPGEGRQRPDGTRPPWA